MFDFDGVVRVSPIDYVPIWSLVPQHRGHVCWFPFLTTFSPLPESGMMTAQHSTSSQCSRRSIKDWFSVKLKNDTCFSGNPHPTPQASLCACSCQEGFRGSCFQGFKKLISSPDQPKLFAPSSELHGLLFTKH